MTDLMTWFGFKRFPFDKEIKTKNILQTDPIKECLARLDYIKRRGGIMLLTGDPGIGKTFAMRYFVENLNDNIYRYIYTALSTVNRIDLLRHISAMLGLPNRTAKSGLYTQIQQEILSSKEQHGRTLFIIIDEAHLLKPGPLQELRLLTNFKMDSCDPFVLILAGQSDLRRTMEFSIMEPLAQRLAMRFHIAPLQLHEVEGYLIHHIQLAGCSEMLFSKSTISAIHEMSFGIPRKIGNIAVQGLTYAMFDQKRSVSPEMILKIGNND